MRAALTFLVLATAVALAVIEGAAYVALHRQDFFWTRLDLDEPVGLATRAKLVGLRGDPRQCRRLLADIGDADAAAPAVRAGPDCGYADGMRLLPEDRASIHFQPPAPVTSCAMAGSPYAWAARVSRPTA